MSNRANLANGITATAISASSNTVALQPGYAAGMPPVPFFATITPFGQLPTMGNSEIVQVTSASGNNLSVVRSQKGTVAKSFPAGSVFTNSVYADDKITADNIDLTTIPTYKYSTTEQDTGQKWINGKTIYQKTFIMGGLGLATTIKKPHNISNLDLVIRIQGIAKENSIGATINLPHAADQQPYTVTVYADNTNVNIQTYADQSGYTQSYVTLWYVKK